MPLTELAVDDGPHSMDGLLLHAWEGSVRVEAFISRPVMDSWIDPREPDRGRRSLLRAQYNALGKFNLATIERIVVSKYQRGAAFNRQHPFLDILLSDIMESEEALDTSELVREPPPPSFQRSVRRRHTLTLGLNAEYARQSSWYRPSVSLKARLTLSAGPNPRFASRSKQSRYKPSRATRGPLFAKIQTWRSAIQRRMEMEATLPSLDQLRIR
jgi:hypothetical protein